MRRLLARVAMQALNRRGADEIVGARVYEMQWSIVVGAAIATGRSAGICRRR